VVVRNAGGSGPRAFTLDLTELPNVGAEATIYRTSRTEDLEPQPGQPLEDFRLVVSTPGDSLTTIVVPVP